MKNVTEKQETQKTFNPTVIRLRWSWDRKRVILSITYLGFFEDLKEFIEGKRAVFRMKQIPKAFKVPPVKKFNPQIVRMYRSQDGKRVFITVSYVGFAQDLTEFLNGSRGSFRLKLLPPYDPTQAKKSLPTSQSEDDNDPVKK